jgi:hypothetical protein
VYQSFGEHTVSLFFLLCSTDFSTLKMVAVNSETMVNFCQAAWYYIPENGLYILCHCDVLGDLPEDPKIATVML